MSEEQKKTYKHSEVGPNCVYSGRIGNYGVNDICAICDYMLKTGKRRGCSGEACDKYVPKPESDKPKTKTGRKKKED